MKNIFLLLTASLLILSCKNETEKPEISDGNSTSTTSKDMDLAQKVADQAGLKAWNDVETVKFTFNVSKNGDTLSSRKWTWNPKTDAVQLVSKGETVSYSRNKNIDSLYIGTDRTFINDFYWLFPAFKLVWDEGTRISYPTDNLIKLEYTGDGGYTPGDRYDLTIDNNNDISEWSYFRAGADLTDMTTSFENYEDYNGIRIARDHKTPDGNLNIFFTDIEIIKNTEQ